MKDSDLEILSAVMDGEGHALDVRRAVLELCGDEEARARWARYHLARDAMRAEGLAPCGSVAARISAALADEPSYSNVTAIGGAAVVPASVPAPAAGEGGPDGGAADAADAIGPTARSPSDIQPPEAQVGGEAAAGLVAPARGRSATRTFAAGFGLAASVALVTFLGLNAWQDGVPGAGTSDGDVSVASAEDAAEATPAPEAGSSAIMLASSDRPAVPYASASREPSDPFSLQLPGAPLPRVELVANTGVYDAGAYWVAPDSSARGADSEERLNLLLSRHIEYSPTSERQGMLRYSRLVGYDERAPER